MRAKSKPSGSRRIVVHDREFFYLVGRSFTKIIDATTNKSVVVATPLLAAGDVTVAAGTVSVTPAGVAAWISTEILKRPPPVAKVAPAPAPAVDEAPTLPTTGLVWYVEVTSIHPDERIPMSSLHMICDDPQTATEVAERGNAAIDATLCARLGRTEPPRKRRRTQELEPGCGYNLQPEGWDTLRAALPIFRARQATFNRPVA